MDAFTVHDLSKRIGDLIRNAEQGKLSLVTKRGRPVFIAVPFDETLLKEGVQVALAVRLFDDGVISLGKAAKLAGMPQAAFIGHLGALRIPVARYGSQELAQELADFG